MSFDKRIERLERRLLPDADKMPKIFVTITQSHEDLIGFTVGGEMIPRLEGEAFRDLKDRIAKDSRPETPEAALVAVGVYKNAENT